MERPISPPPAAAAAPHGLLRLLGVGFGVAVIVGSTLGVGILRTPGLVAAQVPSTANIFLVWIVGGIYTLLASVCLTELGSMLPEAGGYYAYARRAFGDTVGFAVGWTDWLTYCAVLGYVSIAMGEFTVLLVPSLAGATKVVAVVMLLGFTGLQLAGVRVSSRFQQVTTAVKFVAFLLLVGACLAHALTAGAPADVEASALAAPGFSGLVGALQAVVVTYGGWQSALYFAEEDCNPQRNLPRSMIGGVAAVLVVYLLVNVALMAVLPIATLAQSTLAAADAARVVFGGGGARVITLLSIVSLPPMLNAIMMIGSRIVFALGRDRLLWARTAQVSDGGTPVVANGLTTAIAVVLIATGTFQTLVAVASVYLAANCFVTCLALIALRRREPETARPFRAWGYPWSAYLVIAAGGAFLLGTIVGDPRTALSAVALLVGGLVLRPFAARLAGVAEMTKA